MMGGGAKEEDSQLTEAQKEEDAKFVKEELDQEYYTRVKSSDVFYRRKKLILENLDMLESKVKH
jgi:hypothetical protein